MKGCIHHRLRMHIGVQGTGKGFGDKCKAKLTSTSKASRLPSEEYRNTVSLERWEITEHIRAHWLTFLTH